LAGARGIGAFGVGFVGCGDTRPRPGELTAIAHRFQVAVARREVREACSLLDSDGQSMIRRELARYIAIGHTGSSCAALIGFIHDDLLSPQARKEVSETADSEESVTPSTAIVRPGKAYNSGIIRLTRRNGRWQISEIPLATSK
jgi:hypothetical protein